MDVQFLHHHLLPVSLAIYFSCIVTSSFLKKDPLRDAELLDTFLQGLAKDLF